MVLLGVLRCLCGSQTRFKRVEVRCFELGERETPSSWLRPHRSLT